MDRGIIHSDQYLVISQDRNNKGFSMATSPRIHLTYSNALQEAQRLALSNPARKFIVVAVAAVCATPELHGVEVKYSI